MSLPPELAHPDGATTFPPAPPAEAAGRYPITQALDCSLGLRVPRVRELEPAARAAALEDFMLDSAIVASDLARERIDALSTLAALEDEWDDLSPLHNRGGRSKATVNDERRAVNPRLARRMKELRWLAERCAEEMARLEKDGRLVSRAYTPYTR